MSSKTQTIAKKEAAEPALVPKLRFPGFRNAPGWEPKRLGLALKFQAGFPFPSSGFNDIGNGLRLIRNRDLRSDDIVVFYSGEIDPSFIVRNGDVLVGMDGDFTPSVWEKGEALLNQRVGRILPLGDNDHRFLLHLLTLSLKGIEEATARTTVKHLSHSAVENKHEPMPRPAEQQKIAECLSSVDELMAAQARKVDALKTHKKGLMQQLFPRDGETQPRLRFPEFQHAAGWEPKTLVDACRMQAGKFIAAADIKELNSGDLFPCFGGNGLRGFTATYTHDGVYPLIGRQGALCGNVKLASAQFHATEHAVVATPSQGVEVVWLYYLLDLLNLNRFATGQAQPGLSVDVLEKIPVRIPASKSEQQRISSCLSSLDSLISAETQKLEAHKTHKKALMQQLFPSREE
jgi:type I restriction enzyme S subunit